MRRYRADVETRLRRPEPRHSPYRLVDVGGGLMLPEWTVKLFGDGVRPPAQTISSRTDDLPF